ncbi:hypothetical protein IHN32_09780 [Deinococcus sp. 14RED07]|uniref:hypothetical protein n=1 Tax=unclassified Deinococcus TaxID=2623546 RepID=UPI001E469D41|nr:MULTISPECIES: hypothetical protein [unclassified Deinococcus]MCD0159881.1 hypothetical protein [Deinococcus sp. 6YEL10]MCD0166329.1 hypothetical protein [Deinococcus sp. 12RED42]MCD0176229.1 hypothetical protein [Deinococcus sp. 14RED07]
MRDGRGFGTSSCRSASWRRLQFKPLSIDPNGEAKFNTAFGFGNNPLIFVSSDQNKTAVELKAFCDVFLGLNATAGAQWTDGASAAGLVYAGDHKNPTNTRFMDGARKVLTGLGVTKE